MTSFPIAAPAFDGRSRVIGVDAVFAWLAQGASLFMANPLLWLLSALILIAGAAALSAVWLAGLLLCGLLAPVLAGGLLCMCRKTANGQEAGLADLLEGFRTQTAPLMLLGVIFMLVSLIINLLFFKLILFGLIGAFALPDSSVGALLGLFFLWVFFALLDLLLMVPLLMSMWFAPALVLFNGMSAGAACRASFGACFKNFLPFAILGLVVCVLSFFAALLAGLGFLVLIPVLAGTAHASYQDVFVAH